MDECCAPSPLNSDGPKKQNDAYRRVLWAVLAINAAMFAVEVIAGLAAGSASLQADSLDFLGDAANYAISLLVVGMALRYRASAALAKGATRPLSASGLSEPWFAMLSTGRCRAPSPWAWSAWPR
jgi:Co/Zn/Cd efflux system component